MGANLWHMARSGQCKMKIRLDIQASQKLKRLGKETEGVVIEGVRTCAKHWGLKSTIHIYICKYMIPSVQVEKLRLSKFLQQVIKSTPLSEEEFYTGAMDLTTGSAVSQQEVLNPNQPIMLSCMAMHSC